MRSGFLAIAILTGLAAGCGTPEASFVFSEDAESLHKEVLEGRKSKDGDLKGIKTVIDENFGTPNELVAWLKLPIQYGGTPEETAKAADADSPLAFGLSSATGEQLEAQKLQPGYYLASGRRLYMEHCMHCHGTSGDGAGPTAEYLYPRPRDYRKGLFKFTSTKEGLHATTGDLKRIVKMGIPGTYMPSFMLLGDEELSQIVEYVRWLSMRGEVENALVNQFATDYSRDAIADAIKGGAKMKEILADIRSEIADMDSKVDEAAGEIADAWTMAGEDGSQIRPSVHHIPDSEESRRRGREVFISANAKCTNCHGPLGLGNGKQTEEYEDNDKTKRKWDEPGLHDQWGNIVKPRNLTTGIYRGGRRPIDVFRRVRAGIKGSGMPAFGTSVIPDEDLWHLVNYVKSIPFGPTTPAAATGDEKAAAEAKPAG